MKLTISQPIITDVLVIGSGAAGLRAAIEAKRRGLNTLLVSESPVGLRNNTAISKASIATAGFEEKAGDSPAAQVQDTMLAGRLINDESLVQVMARGGKQQIDDLIEFGVNIIRRDGKVIVRQAPGHTHPRNVVTEANKGINITRPLRQYASRIGVQFMEGILITRLLQNRGKVVGALGIDGKGQVFPFSAKSTILATGGAGYIYLRTNNPIGLSGDGYALAYEAGVVLRDMEFVQFYPTASGEQGSKMCMYEWYLPIGAIIRNSLGEDILKKHGMNEFTSVTREKLSKAIVQEVTEGRGVNGSVIFDLTTIPQEKAEKAIRSGLLSKGGNLIKLPVAPTVHHFMGGIRINENAETGVGGLFAAGEVCGGIHGASRLAGNALCEAFVFGAIAGDRAATKAASMKLTSLPKGQVTAELSKLTKLGTGSGQISLAKLQHSLRQTMWEKAGIIRDSKSLESTLKEITTLRKQLAAISLTDYQQLPQAVKLSNMLTVSEMVCQAALTRSESRGVHYRSDFPKEDNQWLMSVEIFQQEGDMNIRAMPTPLAIRMQAMG